MAAAPRTPEPPPADVVLDLLAEDAGMREALGKPIAIRLKTGKVITVPPAGEWPHLAPRYAANKAHDVWARSVLSEDDWAAWQEADMRTYQVERVMAVVEAAGDATPGK